MKDYSISHDTLRTFLEKICLPARNGKSYHVFKNKDVIYAENDDADTFAYILSGKVSIVNRHSENDFVVASVGEGDVLGEMGLFMPIKTRTSSAIAVEDTKVIIIPYDAFLIALDDNYLPLLHMAKVMAKRLSVTTKRADSIATRNVKGRLIDLLSEMLDSELVQEKSDEGVTFKMSRKEMSLIIGCSRELAGRYLSELKEQGVLDYSGMKITVFNSIKTIGD